MAGASATFGKRGQGAVQRMGKPPATTRQSRAPHPRTAARPTPRPTSPKATERTAPAAASEPFQRVEPGFKDLLVSIGLIIMGASIWRYMDDPGLFMLAISWLLMAGGAVIVANFFTRRASFLADETGFGNESLIGNRHMRWEDVEAFQVTTVNFVTTVNARASKKRHPSSKRYVNVPVSVFKDKDMTFVTNLLARRPDMAEPTVFVMKKVGAKKLLKKLME